MGSVENDPLTEKIIGCCFEVHKALGPGFLEKVYSRALQHQLQLSGIVFEAERSSICFLKTKM
ncbi:GxxExxY protein [Inquilinus sp. KBS0705]|nr:GxxExxY protein [Inquilinus sp. KBS0705]